MNCLKEVLDQLKNKKDTLISGLNSSEPKPTIFGDEDVKLSHDRIMSKALVKSIKCDFRKSHDTAWNILQFSYLHFYELYRICFFQKKELAIKKSTIYAEFKAKFKDFTRKYDKSEKFLTYSFNQGLLMKEALDLLCEIWLRFLSDDKKGLQNLINTKFSNCHESFEARTIYDFTDEGLLDHSLFKQEVRKLHSKALESFSGLYDNLQEP